MYEVIHTSSDFILRDKHLGRFPLIVNSQSEEGDAYHFEEAREYFLHKAFTKHTDISSVRDEASIICKFLNYMSVVVNGVQKPRNWMWCTVDTIKKYQTKLQNNNEINSAKRRNRHILTIYDFYFFCEKSELIRGVIGVNDSTKRNSPTYAIPVHKSHRKGKDKLDYFIDHLERTSTGQRPDIDNPDKWDEATNIVQASNSRLSKRDELMLRVVREDYLRREELAYLVTDQFTKITREKVVHVKLLKSKGDKQKGTRTVKFDKELYNDLVRFVNRGRRLLTKTDVNSNALFLSQKTGKRFTLSAINKIFKKYGVRPHDGRSVGLTERFIELIEQGNSRETCLEIVAQEAGHSSKTKGQTLLIHYLQAEASVKKKSIGTKESEELHVAKAKIAELEQEIERLKQSA